MNTNISKEKVKSELIFLNKIKLATETIESDKSKILLEFKEFIELHSELHEAKCTILNFAFLIKNALGKEVNLAEYSKLLNFVIVAMREEGFIISAEIDENNGPTFCMRW